MKEKLEEIIQWIEKSNNASDAYVDISADVDDHTLISGNPAGLRLLAAELLRRASEIEEGALLTSDIPDGKWILDDYLPLSITGLKEAREKIIESKAVNENIENRNSGDSWGCVIIAVVISVLMILGIIYLIRLF
jgi:hypothetical protein